MRRTRHPPENQLGFVHNPGVVQDGPQRVIDTTAPTFKRNPRRFVEITRILLLDRCFQHFKHVEAILRSLYNIRIECQVALIG